MIKTFNPSTFKRNKNKNPKKESEKNDNIVVVVVVVNKKRIEVDKPASQTTQHSFNQEAPANTPPTLSEHFMQPLACP